MRSKRRGSLSLGSIVMLTITAVVALGCVWLFPKLTGSIDVRVDAQCIAAAVAHSLPSLRGEPPSVPRVTPAVVTPPPADFVVAEPTPSSAFTPAPTIAPTDPPKQTLTITAAGSIAIDASLQKAYADDDGYQFDAVFDQLDLTADLSLATLENTVISTDKYTDVNAPAAALAALSARGLNALCTGFYGALNGGMAGVSATADAIAAAGMTPYGVYASAERTPALVRANGVTVALLSYQTDLSSAGKKKTTAEERAYAVSQPKLPDIAADIQTARGMGAQVVVVSLCWGKDSAASPTKTQRELAQGIAEAGADLILGTHSDALQTGELLTAKRPDGSERQTLCAYSLGNLLTSDREKRSSISSILLHARLTLDPATGYVHFDSLTYTPTYVWRGKENGKTGYRVLISSAESQPECVESEQRKVMERCLKLVSDVMADTPVAEAR